jgi:glucan phosphoethanolaminetransferase (alkaline phosphatase superfamily)
MLLSMMIILAITSTILELMIASKVKWWRQKSYQSKLFNMLNSLFLSFLIGLAFSASGLIAMGAGVISTVLTVPGYQFLHWNYDSEQAQKHNGNMMQHMKSKWLQTIKDFFTLVYKILRIITFPIWGTRWAVTKIKAVKTK